MDEGKIRAVSETGTCANILKNARKRAEGEKKLEKGFQISHFFHWRLQFYEFKTLNLRTVEKVMMYATKGEDGEGISLLPFQVGYVHFHRWKVCHSMLKFCGILVAFRSE